MSIDAVPNPEELTGIPAWARERLGLPKEDVAIIAGNQAIKSSVEQSPALADPGEIQESKANRAHL